MADFINKWLSAFQAVAVIIGVGVAIWQLKEISKQTRIQSQALQATQTIESAKLVLELANKIEGSEYKKITSAIQEHDKKYPLISRSKGSFRDTEIEEYIGNFEDIGLLVQEKSISADMAYNHFSYDIEKAWCNRDVQQVIAGARKSDKSIIAPLDKMYGQFERLAQEYLTKEQQTCDDLDKQ